MRHPLPIIVSAQFLCTSLWFAANAVVPDWVQSRQFPEGAVGHLTGAVQLGFIVGTFVYAFFSVADRISPSRVFFISALLGAFTNLGVLIPSADFISVLGFRFSTGFFLAGIYPVGMKIASDYYEKGLGASLGWLVGALVLGTAFPHLVRGVTAGWEWETVIYTTSAFAILGGISLWGWVPDGPFRKPGMQFEGRDMFRVFRHKAFRRAALGYFGHMWELYTFWAFVPALLLMHSRFLHHSGTEISRWAFLIIGVGSLGCLGAGLLSQRIPPRVIGLSALSVSGFCCLLSPLAFFLPWPAFLIFLCVWGAMVVADSPMFSTLVAAYAPQDRRATALTLVNGIGFGITILSIEFLQGMAQAGISPHYLFLWLAPGPILGVLAICKSSST
jgi:MFS family permease